MEFGIWLRPPPLSYHPFSLLFYSTPSDPLPGGKLSCLSPFEQQTLLIHRQTNKFGTRRLQKLRGHRSAPVDFDCEVFEQPVYGESCRSGGGRRQIEWRGSVFTLIGVEKRIVSVLLQKETEREIFRRTNNFLHRTRIWD